MLTLDQIVQLYRDLADWHEREGPAHVRDRFLILAADAALQAGRDDEAERIRQRLLHLNPHHMLRPFASFAEALRSPDVSNYVGDLRHNYPPETAEQILAELRGGNRSPEPRPTLPLPPTLPVVELTPPAVSGSTEKPDRVVVYWDETEAEPPPAAKPAKRPTVARPPARPTTSSPTQRQPAQAVPTPPSARPATPRRDVHGLPTESPGRATRSRPSQEETEEGNGGTWVSSALFGLLLLVSLVLGTYALVRPFLPPEWLPR
jgi:hypothetical protein